MDKIIMSGSVAAASCPGFGMQDETMKTADNMDDELDDTKEDGKEEEQEEVEPEPVPRRRGKKKRASNGKPTEPCVKSTSKEDECLAEAWKTLVDPDFANIHMDCDDKAMANHWATIQMACNKWHGIVEEVDARPKSGTNVEGQMVRMFSMYRQDNSDQEFKFLHVFSRIESCGSEGKFGSLSPRPRRPTIRTRLPELRQKGAPMAPKKPGRRGTRRPLPNNCNLRSSCITDAKNSAAKREEKFDARWSVLMTKQDVKVDLLRTNVAAKKRNTNLAFLMGQTCQRWTSR
ncbi:putative methionyl-tRNA synthetase [Hordeum vulgare]|nr:putative methionyl-tRNA synthetase [Hordeum vulgare]